MTAKILPSWGATEAYSRGYSQGCQDMIDHLRDYVETRPIPPIFIEMAPSMPVIRLLQLQQAALDSAGSTAENFWKLIDEAIRQAEQPMGGEDD